MEFHFVAFLQNFAFILVQHRIKIVPCFPRGVQHRVERFWCRQDVCTCPPQKAARMPLLKGNLGNCAHIVCATKCVSRFFVRLYKCDAGGLYALEAASARQGVFGQYGVKMPSRWRAKHEVRSLCGVALGISAEDGLIGDCGTAEDCGAADKACRRTDRADYPLYKIRLKREKLPKRTEHEPRYHKAAALAVPFH